jgi:uncharacterized membrane protein
MSSRLVTLTDGVITVAMTLLVLDIRLPSKVEHGALRWTDLLAVREQVFSYGLSFIVIALLWLTHAQKFRYVARMTSLLFWLNTLFLLAVGLLPFTTSLLASSKGSVGPAVYAGVMAFACLMLTIMALHVTTAGLASPDSKGERLKPADFLQFLSAAVFLASIPISFWNVDWAQRCWLLLIPIAFIPDKHDRAKRIKPA